MDIPLSTVAESHDTTYYSSYSESKSDCFDISKNVKKYLPSWIQKNHPLSQIIGDATNRVRTREKQKVNYQNMVRFVCFTLLIESENIFETLKDECQITAMQE